MALLGALAGVGFIIGIALMVIGKIKKKKYHGGKIALVSLVVFIFALVMTPTNNENETMKPSSTSQNEAKEEISWQDKVKEVAAMDGSETEKFDEISLYAMEYQPTEKEIKEFEEYIISEYKSGNYLNDLSDHEYMLENIFKSQVVERYYDEDEPMKDFAFDFWQNSKYAYRSVDDPDSTAVKSNEEQMDKTLAEMGR